MSQTAIATCGTIRKVCVCGRESSRRLPCQDEAVMGKRIKAERKNVRKVLVIETHHILQPPVQSWDMLSC